MYSRTCAQNSLACAKCRGPMIRKLGRVRGAGHSLWIRNRAAHPKCFSFHEFENSKTVIQRMAGHALAFPPEPAFFRGVDYRKEVRESTNLGLWRQSFCVLRSFCLSSALTMQTVPRNRPRARWSPSSHQLRLLLIDISSGLPRPRLVGMRPVSVYTCASRTTHA